MSNYPSGPFDGFPTPSKCTNCNGTKLEPDPAYPYEECSVCEGTGIYTPPSFVSNRMEVKDGVAYPNPAIEPNDMRFDSKWQELNKSSSIAFSLAWSVLKSNTIPIRPRVMQYATDPKKTMRLEQTGGIARRAREKLMDEVQAERNHNHPDSFSEGETDVMNQKGREQTPREERNQYEQMLEDFQNSR